VTQEALKNAAMHSKASYAWVTATREGTDLVLTIRDDGSGFDLAEARGRGLGLISLEERVRHVGGRLAIDTGPQHGTTIRVVVPLA
jgi:signal transduction histidine kinase